MPNLVLVRHGQSEWNLQNRFTGWVDVNLTEEGEAQARKAGVLMKAAGFTPAHAFSSMLTRAIRTANIALAQMGLSWVPLDKSWRLNERHYGALTGLDKAETIKKHGEDQVKIWRRSYDTPPPALDDGDERHPRFDTRYSGLPGTDLPATESLATTLVRVQPYWYGEIATRLKKGEDILIAAHGNSLRAIVKLLFNVSPDDILKIEIPTGNPLLIELDEDLKPVAVRYLDADRAQALPALP
ncbi:MAG: 2,3-diphosphoglycerate-dependent phosphoglycerate mutase [Maricaulis sp.]|jgi:2,3-bisphosphoglycerate-dependent phosphoglycerate mutase|nr:2,3-diphosphoglycerate-dependent phosphoglycerate mutase [Maricaulis sp.]HAQ35582.1 2,3-diphosphoglycerate-dependent phosphoglycerate mutase [Alphaproteobacteria bacterium]